jgi:hypothetical protein
VLLVFAAATARLNGFTTNMSTCPRWQKGRVPAPCCKTSDTTMILQRASQIHKSPGKRPTHPAAAAICHRPTAASPSFNRRSGEVGRCRLPGSRRNSEPLVSSSWERVGSLRWCLPSPKTEQPSAKTPSRLHAKGIRRDRACCRGHDTWMEAQTCCARSGCAIRCRTGNLFPLRTTYPPTPGSRSGYHPSRRPALVPHPQCHFQTARNQAATLILANFVELWDDALRGRLLNARRGAIWPTAAASSANLLGGLRGLTRGRHIP